MNDELRKFMREIAKRRQERELTRQSLEIEPPSEIIINTVYTPTGRICANPRCNREVFELYHHKIYCSIECKKQYWDSRRNYR